MMKNFRLDLVIAAAILAAGMLGAALLWPAPGRYLPYHAEPGHGKSTPESFDTETGRVVNEHYDDSGNLK
jgi:hypothetical protein